MTGRGRVVVIGASAGGVEALRVLVGGFPPDFDAPVLIVLHISPDAPSVLPEILTKAGPLPASHAKTGESLTPGRILVAPPDHHLLVHDSSVRVVRGPQENRNRPAIDPLFRSAAVAWGSGTVGVLLSGLLDDGTAGLVAIKVAGGTVIVQDPNDAMFSSMPRSALRYVQPDEVLPASAIGSRLAELVQRPASKTQRPDAPRESDAKQTRIAEFDMREIESGDRIGRFSSLTCPDCHGNLWESHESELLQFRCRVGHAYSSDSMIAALDDSVERALWAALRALEERAALARRVSEGAEGRNLASLAQFYRERVEQAESDAELVRGILKTAVRTS